MNPVCPGLLSAIIADISIKDTGPLRKGYHSIFYSKYIRKRIINTVIFVVGMLAVIMIILGGVNYATSQGDPNKVNKAKSTIMYGIIGLVICLLAFAIVNFVLQALA